MLDLPPPLTCPPPLWAGRASRSNCRLDGAPPWHSCAMLGISPPCQLPNEPSTIRHRGKAGKTSADSGDAGRRSPRARRQRLGRSRHPLAAGRLAAADIAGRLRYQPVRLARPVDAQDVARARHRGQSGGHAHRGRMHAVAMPMAGVPMLWLIPGVVWAGLTYWLRKKR